MRVWATLGPTVLAGPSVPAGNVARVGPLPGVHAVSTLATTNAAAPRNRIGRRRADTRDGPPVTLEAM
jgi:hypothetical protein